VPSRSVVVFGGDRAALTVATRLALDGHSVVLWEPPSSDESLPTPCERPRIEVESANGAREATLVAATADPFEALAAADMLLAWAAPDGLAVMAELVLPLIESRHTLVVLGGGLHALAAARWLRDHGRSELPTLAASDTAPVADLGFKYDRLRVAVPTTHVGFGVFPAHQTEVTITALADLFPGAVAHPHVIAAALASVEPMLRAIALLMNLGAAERSRVGSSVFEDGFTESVASVAEVLDGERMALAAALGLCLPSSAEALHAWGLSPRGDLWSAVNGSFALARRSDEISPDDRLASDVARGIGVWVELADQLGVPAPVARSLVALCDAASTANRQASGWSLEDLGIAGMSAESLRRFLTDGSDDQAI
jgi:opine dehydrogenase